MTRSERVQNIRRMLFTDLIAEVDEMLAESNDDELSELHEALKLDPGNRVLEKLKALKVAYQSHAPASATPAPPEKKPVPPPEKKPVPPAKKEMKW